MKDCQYDPSRFSLQISMVNDLISRKKKKRSQQTLGQSRLKKGIDLKNIGRICSCTTTTTSRWGEILEPIRTSSWICPEYSSPLHRESVRLHRVIYPWRVSWISRWWCHRPRVATTQDNGLWLHEGILRENSISVSNSSADRRSDWQRRVVYWDNYFRRWPCTTDEVANISPRSSCSHRRDWTKV